MIGSVGPDLVQKVRAVFLWNITKDGKRVSQWSELECNNNLIGIV